MTIAQNSLSGESQTRTRTHTGGALNESLLFTHFEYKRYKDTLGTVKEVF